MKRVEEKSERGRGEKITNQKKGILHSIYKHTTHKQSHTCRRDRMKEGERERERKRERV